MPIALMPFGGSALLLMGLAAAPAEIAPPTPISATALFSAGAIVTDDELGASTGRDDLLMIATANNRSTVTNNRVVGNSVTGAIHIDEQAFSDLSGLSVVSANTGNNVSINASMVVNVALSPNN